MIKSIKVLSGYAAELPICQHIATCPLSESLNILWGANGSGKTTLLNIAAAYTFCYAGGWSRLMEPLEIGSFTSRALVLPDDLVKQSPGKSEAVLTWDRVPVFFANGLDKSTSGMPLDAMADDGMNTVMSEIATAKLTPRSSGETRRVKLTNVLGNLQQGAPDFKDIQLSDGLNSTWRRCFEQQIDYLKERPDDARITVLMDEPERHLDLKAASDFWMRIVPHLRQHVQLVIATHHPLALRYVHTGETNWYTSAPGEHEAALKIYRKAFE